jgi:selenide,water dikinase
VHPDRILTNAGAQPGDVLFLTKPLGTGTISTALKAGKGTPSMEKRVCEIMTVLNGSAARACQEVGVHACTDISGFGLLGHAFEMAEASGVRLLLEFAEIPVLPDAVETVRKGFVPGGTKANLLYVTPRVTFAENLGETEKFLIADPQTSGGLLVAVEEPKREELTAAFREHGVEAFRIGRVADKDPGSIFVE